MFPRVRIVFVLGRDSVMHRKVATGLPQHYTKSDNCEGELREAFLSGCIRTIPDRATLSDRFCRPLLSSPVRTPFDIHSALPKNRARKMGNMSTINAQTRSTAGRAKPRR
jgi:hypothetical protein